MDGQIALRHVQIRSADAAGENAEQQFPRRWLWHRRLPQHQRTLAAGVAAAILVAIGVTGGGMVAIGAAGRGMVATAVPAPGGAHRPRTVRMPAAHHVRRHATTVADRPGGPRGTFGPAGTD